MTSAFEVSTPTLSPPQPLLESDEALTLADEILDSGSVFTLPEPALHPLEEGLVHARVRQRVFGEEVVPPRLGRYRLGRKIGGGGVGLVYEAFDERLQRRVALKVLRPEHFSPDGVAQINLGGEAQALAQLTHPNVVAVYDLGQEGGQVYIAMEYVEGPTLRQWLVHERPSQAAIVDVFVQVAHGLAAAHAQGLIHRDFKPDNVLIASDGQAKILDFGLAAGVSDRRDESGLPRLAADLPIGQTTFSAHGVLLGTPAYMAPEQHLGEAIDARADQFAFAIAFYEALVGCRPFAGEDLRTVTLSIVAGRWQVRNGQRELPAAFVTLLTRALRVDRNQRFATMQEVATALRQAQRLPATAALMRRVEGGHVEDSPEVPALIVPALPPVPTVLGYNAQVSDGAFVECTGQVLADENTRGEVVALLERAVPSAWKKPNQVVADAHGITLTFGNRELRVDPSAHGLTVVVTRHLIKRARARAVLGTMLGGAAGMIAGGIALSALSAWVGFPEPFEALTILAGLIKGSRFGWRKMLRLHVRQLNEEAEQVRYAVKRVQETLALYEAKAATLADS